MCKGCGCGRAANNCTVVFSAAVIESLEASEVLLCLCASDGTPAPAVVAAIIAHCVCFISFSLLLVPGRVSWAVFQAAICARKRDARDVAGAHG